MDKFNKVAFSELLSIAKGNRSQTAFSEEIGISKEHLSRLMNQKTDSPPSLETLRNISYASQGRISYIQLLLAVNYLQQGDLYPNTLNKKPLIAVLMTALSTSFPFQSWSVCDNTNFDLGVAFKHSNVRWYFLCSANLTNIQIDYQMQYNYYQIVKTSIEPNDKISFVTSSLDEYIKFKEIIPSALNADISIILIDSGKLDILKEEQLITHNSNAEKPFFKTDS